MCICFVLLGNTKSFSKVVVPISTPPAGILSSLWSTALPTLCMSGFSIFASLMRESPAHCDFSLHVLVTSEAEHFPCAYWLSVFLCCEAYLEVFSSFSYAVVCLFPVNLQEFFLYCEHSSFVRCDKYLYFPKLYRMTLHFLIFNPPGNYFCV